MSATEKRTYCRICEAACGLVAEIDAYGDVVKLRPDRAHPVSRGFVCAKGTRFHEVARHPDRLLAPMTRASDGALRETSWREALGVAGAKIRAVRERYGPHAVGVYFGNPIAFNALGTAALLAFYKRLGTRNLYSAGSQDCSNKFAGAEILHGSPAIHPIPDFARTDLAVVFGSNPAVSQSSFVHLEGGSLVFDRLIAAGGAVVWVDPRRSESAKRWGEHLAIRPGADAFLLAALVGLFRDRLASDARVEGVRALLDAVAHVTPAVAAAHTGLEEPAIRALAARIRRAPRCALHMSVGVNQGPFGTLAYVLLHALAYLSGNLDREGGSLFHPLSLRIADAFRVMGVGTAKNKSRVGGFESVLDALPGGILADEILTPGDERIRALVVIAGDPLASIPGSTRLAEALRSLDVLVSVDLFENRTGALADVLLPATSWLERWDVATTTLTFQTQGLMQTAPAVTAAPGETRGEERILMDLLAEVTGERWPTVLGGLGLARRLPSWGYGVQGPTPRAGTYLGRGPRTPGHRVRFFTPAVALETARLAQAAELTPDPEAFALIGRRRRLGHNGWLHDARHDGDPEDAAWLSPTDFAAMGLERGQRVSIATDAGAMELPAVAVEGVASRTIVVPHGLPEHNVNELIPGGEAAVERVSGQARMTGVSVRVGAVR